MLISLSIKLAIKMLTSGVQRYAQIVGHIRPVIVGTANMKIFLDDNLDMHSQMGPDQAPSRNDLERLAILHKSVVFYRKASF